MITFEEFVVGRWGRLVRSAVLMGADLATAEDLVQTTLMKCYTSWDRVIGAADIDAYVARMLLNVMRDRVRRRSHQEVVVEAVPETALIPDSGSDISHALEAALDRLDTATRQTIVLRFYVDLTELQTADVMGVPVGTVKSRTSRALHTLRDDTHLSAFTADGKNDA